MNCVFFPPLPFHYGITVWSTSSHSDGTDFSDIYTGGYTARMVEDYPSQLHEKTAHQSCPPHNSRSQFSAPPTISAEVDQYLNIQPQSQFDFKDHVNFRYDEVNLGAKSYIDIYRQKNYQLPQIGGMLVADRQDCSTIPNGEAKGGECGTFDFKGESEAGHVNVWAVEEHKYNNVWAMEEQKYNILTDTSASDIDQFYFA